MDYCVDYNDVMKTTNCSKLNDILTSLSDFDNCTMTFEEVQKKYNTSNCIFLPAYDKGVSILVIFIIALIGNIGTIIILSKFKVHKVPDVLVSGLALNDLFTNLVPIPMSMFAYFKGINYLEGSFLCRFFGFSAQFSRYSSALIVTLVSLERYYAVNRPFIYRKYATPKKFVFIICGCWLIALALAIGPVVENNTIISQHDGFCLFDLSSYYAIVVLGFAGIQYVTVLVCFILVSITLLKVQRRRKKLKVPGNFNYSSSVHSRVKAITVTKANLTTRISDLGKSIKKAAPIITEKFQLGVEAQFARMLFAVVVLFYISWTTIVVIIIISQIQQSEQGLEYSLFWGIRLSIISTAINPVLYGVLARQYRLAYWYVLKLWLSKCCCYCVSPPLKDVFAAVRNFGDTRETSIHRTSHSKYGLQPALYHYTGNMLSQNSCGAILTHNSHTNGTHSPNLDIIHEDYSLDHKSTAAEFTTHLASAGELSSSVTIPHQARDNLQDNSTVDLQVRVAVSMHNLVDSGLVEFGDTQPPSSGVQNPLAMITKVVNGEEVIVSPGGSDMDSDESRTLASPLFTNPLYEISNTLPKSKTLKHLEAQWQHRPQQMAVSSTDNIALSSNTMRPLGKARSNEIIPYHFFAEYLSPGHNSKQHANNSTTVGVRLPPSSLKLKASHQIASSTSHIPSPLLAKAIDTGLSVTVLNNSTRKLVPLKSPVVTEKLIQTASNKRPVTVLHLHTKSLDDGPSISSTSSMRNHRIFTSSPSFNGANVLQKKEKLAGLETQPSTSTSDKAAVVSAQQSHSQTRTGTGCRSSTDNSDSGHESMLDSADNVIPERPAFITQ